jgi:hypothetical protein
MLFNPNMPGLLDKAVQFATSDEGKKIGKSAFDFLKNTGLAKKGLEKIKDKVSKKKKIKSPTLHNLTLKGLEKLIGKTTPSKEQGYASAALDFAKDSGLGAKALDKANQSIAEKSKDKPHLEFLRRIAASEAQKAIPFSSGTNIDNSAPQAYTDIKKLVDPFLPAIKQKFRPNALGRHPVSAY